MRYKIWIDRGGTFTDCICVDQLTGKVRVEKLLSGEHSVVDGIRLLLGVGVGEPVPACEVRMGTTIATNALLERKGTPCVLITSRGFADVPEIGTQARPDLFALDIRKPRPLHSAVVELELRGTHDGRLLGTLDRTQLDAQLQNMRDCGINSAAVVLLHAHKSGLAECQVRDAAKRAGLQHVALSHEVSNEIGLLARGDTTLVDAYLTPLLRDYLRNVCDALPESSVRLMQSSGGLTAAQRLRGPNAILSGPAGGVVAYSAIARATGYDQVIGFDMGGTSTDVSRFAGEFERSYENEVSGVRLRAPMLAIHTVAAGGGSICRYDGQRFTVGPDSAGARPGPLCYGSPDADALTVTDVNLVLGRLPTDRFPFPLDKVRPLAALQRIAERLHATGREISAPAVAQGFFEIANLNMAEAIRQVSVARGYDVRTHALFVFGGAGGQHACAIARALEMRAVLFHELSGVLSAYGMGLADVTVHREADAGGVILTQQALDGLTPEFERLEANARATLAEDDYTPDAERSQRLVDLRYRGTQTRLTLKLAALLELERTFTERHASEFGYARRGHPIELAEIRVEMIATSRTALLSPSDSKSAPAPLPSPLRTSRLWWEGQWLTGVPVFGREQLVGGQLVTGPALIVEQTGTIVLEPGFELRAEGALLVATRRDAQKTQLEVSKVSTAKVEARPDPILLEVMNHQYMSIAEQMGHVLRRTALSTNIRERLDFSCAVFDDQAQLIANAPHIPVHLGAMGESVRAVFEAHPTMEQGDAFITNDPAHGGSHLPDVTVVTPVFDQASGQLSFFVASRGHHADIGGITPGSMPAMSTRLAEEGIVLPATRIVHEGRFDRDALSVLLEQGPYPARDPATNLADIEAQLAANQLGSLRLAALVGQYGLTHVKRYMDFVRQNAEAKVREAIAQLPDGTYRFHDALDCGALLSVSITVRGTDMHIDFSGTDAELASNLNAPRAVTIAAVIYFLRTLVASPIPLNAGCLTPVVLTIPPGSLLSPNASRAVVGGNVETSQRIVDILLAAVGRAAASQGTMNNLSFGNQHFGYYETLAGGAGAGPGFCGASVVHTHMTNTRITDPEVLETYYPVRVVQFARRRGSGGAGNYTGGDGLVRELEFLAPVEVSLLTERRTRAPFGLAGGEPGERGKNLLDGCELPPAVQFSARPGSRLRIETPGGGGYGPAAEQG